MQTALRSHWAICLPFLFIGLLLALFVAPNMNVDSSVLVAFELGDLVIPHYQPGYPLFTRGVAFIMDFFSGADGNLIVPTPYTHAKLATIVFAQHALAVAGAAYLARRISSNCIVQFGLTALLYLNPITLEFAHTIMSEALAAPAFYFVSGKTLDVMRSGRLRWVDLALYVLMCVAGALVRLPLLIFALVLPGALFFRACIVRERRVLQFVRAFAIGIGALLVSSLLTGFISDTVMRTAGVTPRSSLGRAFTYIILNTQAPSRRSVEYVATPDMGQIADRVGAHVDPVVRHDLLVVARSTHGGWVGPFNAIVAEEQLSCGTCGSLGDFYHRADERLNNVAKAILLSGDPTYLRHIVIRIREYLTPLTFPFSWRFPIVVYDDPVSGRPQIIDFPALKDTYVVRTLDDISPWAQSFDWLMRAAAFGLALFLTTLAMLVRSEDHRALAALATVVVGVLSAIGMATVTVYVPRYGQTLDIIMLIAITLGATVVAEHFWTMRRTGPTTFAALRPVLIAAVGAGAVVGLLSSGEQPAHGNAPDRSGEPIASATPSDTLTREQITERP